jgi:HAE1 family hydrophobic/amphiphilic exporter-1
MMVVAVILLGYISLGKLNIDLLPEMNAPRIFVEIKAGERPPEEIEKQLVQNVEGMVVRLKSVSQVSSICMVGLARVKVEYNWGTDMDEAFLDLQKALTMYNQSSDVQISITQHDPNSSPVMVIAMLNPAITDVSEMRKTAETYIRNELIRIDGIADVTLSGAEEKEVVIETDQYRLNGFGLTADNLVQQIQGINRSVSGGSVEEMGKRYIIKGTALVKTQQDLENIIVAYKRYNPDQTAVAANIPQSQNINDRVPVYLKDVAQVKITNKKPLNIIRVNGQRCLGLSIYKETSSNTVKAINELNKTLETIKKSLPGYNFIIVQNQGSFIQNAVNELKETGLMGILIAIFVLFIFLRRIGLTAIISFAIPISVIATFNLMYFNGLSLNIMTLGGLALGAGMLVDNAIVVVESIFRNIEAGMSVKTATVKGTSDVGGAIISCTLTHIVVFFPIVYLHGVSSALFKDQAWTVAFSLLASLFVAIFVIPMMFNAIYGKKNKPAEMKSFRFNWYSELLPKILDRRYTIIALAFAFIVATIFILPHVGKEYLPKTEGGEFSLDIKLKEGTLLERTAGTVKNIEVIINQVIGDKADIVYSQIGPSSANTSSDKAVFQNENTANIKIRFKPKEIKQSEKLIAQVTTLLQNIPDAEINVTRDESALASTIGTDEAPMTIEVKGSDIKILDKITREIKQKISAIPDLYNVKTSIEEGAPEIDVVVDRTKASVYNLTTSSITSQLKDQLMGRNAGKFDNSGEMNDITIKMPEMSLSEFNAITIKSGEKDIPLYEVASLEKTSSPRELLRKDQNRIGTVTANIQGKSSFDKVVAKVRKELDNISYPQDYQVYIAGEEQKRQDAMSGLMFALILSVILVYMVMASQFESLIHPFTVLLTIPLASAGAVWAFFLFGRPMNIMAFIGVIMLNGIAVSNSILLVDAINRFKAQGNSLRDAIIKAGDNRIRPIIMTSLITVLALIPLTLGIGESAALRSPMAIAVIAGLSASTILTLAVIPCVYYVFDRKKQ